VRGVPLSGMLTRLTHIPASFFPNGLSAHRVQPEDPPFRKAPARSIGPLCSYRLSPIGMKFANSSCMNGYGSTMAHIDCKEFTDCAVLAGQAQSKATRCPPSRERKEVCARMEPFEGEST
jgi:hypothetical protein